MKTKNTKQINILAFKSKYQSVSKMFTIRESISRSLSVPLRQIMNLSFGRVANLASKVKVTSDFLALILKIKKNHGDDFTIK
jgi:hypothetical protein